MCNFKWLSFLVSLVQLVVVLEAGAFPIQIQSNLGPIDANIEYLGAYDIPWGSPCPSELVHLSGRECETDYFAYRITLGGDAPDVVSLTVSDLDQDEFAGIGWVSTMPGSSGQTVISGSHSGGCSYEGEYACGGPGSGTFDFSSPVGSGEDAPVIAIAYHLDLDHYAIYEPWSAVAVPEPSSAILVFMGGLLLALRSKSVRAYPVSDPRLSIAIILPLRKLISLSTQRLASNTPLL